MKRANALRYAVATGAFWRVAMLATGSIGAAVPADAAYLFWSDSAPGYYSPQPYQSPPRRPQRARRRPAKKEIIKDTAVHPQMPLIINVSVATQRVRVFDANGFFAESPVSTGMPGHPTPMGVFSVIQKDRYHHSTIYSGAPMPYMQRITWGGVALHAGVVPAYPASHGCIRMPEPFAIKMWGWTKLGARVIVSPGELSPSSFEHPLLPAMKVVPQPEVSERTNEPVGLKADKGAADIKPIEANLELRSTVGSNDHQPTADEAKVNGARAESAPAAATIGKSTAEPGDLVSSDATTDAVKDQTRVSGGDKPPKPDGRRKEGQLAIFISRKDSKLYVRQNFAPAWQIPVTITPSDRPLGTHLFTATVDRTDPNVLHWSAVTVPMSARAAMRASYEALPRRGHKGKLATAPVEAKPVPLPDSPAEALDRIQIPPEAMARIGEALTTGASILVSDQGINQGETGEYTDFIIRTY
jgi:lipoprotein-anchoring transpeptidase ErfK/SrfK